MNLCCKKENCSNCPDDFNIYGASFTNPTTYGNLFMSGRMRLNLNGTKKLIYGIDWDYVNPSTKNGGFVILIIGFSVTSDTVICGEFY